MLPGWDSLESVKSITTWLARGTLTGWVLLVLFEIIAHSWDKRKRLFNILALVAFAAAVTGEVVKYRYDERKDVLRDAVEQQLKQNVGELAAQRTPRMLNEEALSQRLKGKPKATIDLWYAPNDTEAYFFAGQIYRALKGAEWKVSEPKPIPADAGEAELNNPNAPPAARFSGVGSRSGLTILSSEPLVLTKTPETPLAVLVDALGQAMSPAGFVTSPDPKLPIDVIRVVIEPKQ